MSLLFSNWRPVQQVNILKKALVANVRVAMLIRTSERLETKIGLGGEEKYSVAVQVLRVVGPVSFFRVTGLVESTCFLLGP